MKKKLEILWPFIGIVAVFISLWILKQKLGKVGFDEISDALWAIPFKGYLYGFLSCFAAYAALAWYDQIALLHLKKKLSWWVVSVVSFVAYALSHNIGASMFTSGVIRYRAYSRHGLSLPEVALLSAFCSFTFAFGVLFLSGLILIIEPEIVSRLYDINERAVFTIGLLLLFGVALYVLASAFRFKPLKIKTFELSYPNLGIALRQLVAAPAEVIGAGAIIYFAIPEAVNPGFMVVMGVFLMSFSAGLLSHAPGGLGVFEAVFIVAMPEVPKAELLAALIVFRGFYLLIPLVISASVVLWVEGHNLNKAIQSLKTADDSLDKLEDHKIL